MPSLAFIEKQLERERQRAKAKADADNLEAVVKRAVADALAQAGVVAAPQPKAPEPPRANRWTRPLRDYSPLPDRTPQSPPQPRRDPAPVTFPDTVIERNELGDITGMSGQYGKLTVRRGPTGLIDTVYLNGRPLTKFVRGFDGRIVKLEPPKGARP